MGYPLRFDKGLPYNTPPMGTAQSLDSNSPRINLDDRAALLTYLPDERAGMRKLPVDLGPVSVLEEEKGGWLSSATPPG